MEGRKEGKKKERKKESSNGVHPSIPFGMPRFYCNYKVSTLLNFQFQTYNKMLGTILSTACVLFLYVDLYILVQAYNKLHFHPVPQTNKDVDVSTGGDEDMMINQEMASGMVMRWITFLIQYILTQ
jgi:hypothetical protein